MYTGEPLEEWLIRLIRLIQLGPGLATNYVWVYSNK